MEKHIQVRRFKYSQVDDLNTFLKENAAKVAESGVMFMPKFVTVQIVEGYDQDDFTDDALNSLRTALRELIVQRLSLETNKRNLLQLKIKYAAPLAPRFCGKCHVHLNDDDKRADLVAEKIQQNASAIEENEREQKNVRDRIAEVKKGDKSLRV